MQALHIASPCQVSLFPRGSPQNWGLMVLIEIFQNIYDYCGLLSLHYVSSYCFTVPISDTKPKPLLDISIEMVLKYIGLLTAFYSLRSLLLSDSLGFIPVICFDFRLTEHISSCCLFWLCKLCHALCKCPVKFFLLFKHSEILI